MKNYEKKINTTTIKKKGFTIVEALVSITILLVAIVAPMTIASRGISLAIHAKEQAIATYLTQDVLEFVRYRMDTNNNLRKSDPAHIPPYTLTEFLVPCLEPNYCFVDTFNDFVGPCAGNVCPNVQQEPVSKLFGHGAGYDTTSFNRELMIRHNGGDEYQVVATTTFGKADNRKSFVIKDLIIDWRDAF